ncbi:hypothetical protein J6590_072473 [Homalodisca vitripennis]|nr:hypothetical protein J6590_072473 [Homalodisca vitripennis]
MMRRELRRHCYNQRGKGDSILMHLGREKRRPLLLLHIAMSSRTILILQRRPLPSYRYRSIRHQKLRFGLQGEVIPVDIPKRYYSRVHKKTLSTLGKDDGQEFKTF